MSGLPRGWAKATLGELGSWQGGGTPDKSNAKFWSSGTIPWVSPKDMKRFHISEAEDQITEAALVESSTNLIAENSVLIVSRSGILKHTLPVAVTGGEVAINQDIKALTPHPELDALFVAHQIKSLGAFVLKNCTKAGTTVDSVDFDRLKSVNANIPPLAEQKRIVAKLDALNAKSARARTELARIDTLVSHYKQAVLSKAFSGKLTQEWRSRHGSHAVEDIEYLVAQERAAMRKDRGLARDGSNRSVPRHSIDLGVIPASWIWLNFGQCSYELTVGHVGPMKDRYVQSGIPFLRSLNVKPNRIELRNLAYIDAGFHAELKKSALKPGDLVVIRTGDPGVAAVVPETMEIANCSDLVICRLIPAVEPNYAAFYMNSSFARSTVGDMQVGVAQQHFNVGAMSKMPVPIPSLQEQHEIVRRIESAFARIDRLAAEARRALELVGRLDEAILAKAFRGELIPQDENDEPAEKLLERIRTERAAAPKAKRGHRQAPPSERTAKKRRTTEMTKTRGDVEQNHLAQLLRATGGSKSPTELWLQSGMGIDEFYKQLRSEIDSGQIREGTDKDQLVLIDAN